MDNWKMRSASVTVLNIPPDLRPGLFPRASSISARAKARGSGSLCSIVCRKVLSLSEHGL